eukprot:TRINITY_DN7080_c2_g1_i2.p2 TRINITY_DN7080_c2_g1~~TRINITY_DN7080_c2_g1_i2.p2  ORF type:complete len:102 (-),score=2.42 TRINITY_DN7080_c2_g1_i2:25-330(-)
MPLASSLLKKQLIFKTQRASMYSSKVFGMLFQVSRTERNACLTSKRERNVAKSEKIRKREARSVQFKLSQTQPCSKQTCPFFVLNHKRDQVLIDHLQKNST